MAFFQTNDNVVITLCIVILAVGVIAAVIATVLAVKNGKKVERSKTVRPAKIVSADDDPEELRVIDGGVVLENDVIYDVGENGQISAGRYVLSAVSGTIKLAINGKEQIFAEESEVELCEGDGVCPLDGAVLFTAKQ